MTIRCEVNETDYRAFYGHVFFKCRKLHWILLGIGAFFSILTWIGNKPEVSTPEKLASVLVLLVLYVGFFLVFWGGLRFLKRFTRTPFKPTVGEHLFELTEQGISESNSDGRVETRWQAIRRFDETQDHFFLIAANGMGYVIPKRCLADVAELRAWKTKFTPLKDS